MEVLVNPERTQWPKLVRRPQIARNVIGERVAQILSAVEQQGDAALLRLTEQIDGLSLSTVVVTQDEREQAAQQVSEPLKQAIGVAAANIRRFHEAQRSAVVDMETMPGVHCVQRAVPIQRVGLYVPGGSAPLFSTVLMLAIPARVAGCREVVLCTPPNKEGGIAPAILYAASVAGVDRIFKVGGAQAIAAMAYGTQSVPKVDKIFGPGNQYVTVAKQQVSTATVAIDMPAGPSEVLVMADESAKPEFVASDLLSQAEHGPDSQVILLTSSRGFAEQVQQQVQQQLARLSRRSLATQALDHSRMIVMDSEEDLIDFSNAYGPEHLILSMSEPWKIAERITAAGSIFLGNYTPESAGDYASGTNHTLPTYGWAHAFSGVNLDSFQRKITYQEITPAGLQQLGGVIETMAAAEGLDAHKNAVTLRLQSLE
ncbi:MAG: histidinol dehydrogenase [Alistipes sp.]|nr:histidinol dehydrogenase [Alistipes sp.]